MVQPCPAQPKFRLPAKRYFQKLELVFNTGIVIKRQDKPLGSDAIRVGKCLSNDKWLNCKGGFNLGICNNCRACRAGNKASVEIKCSN